MKPLKEYTKNYESVEIKIDPDWNDTITEEMVRMMIKDIIYLIPYNYFSDIKDVTPKTIETVASIMFSNLAMGVDLWHSLFMLIKLNEKENINKDFNRNHLSLYYILGGKQILRDYTPLLYLFQSVIMTVSNLMATDCLTQ